MKVAMDSYKDKETWILRLEAKSKDDKRILGSMAEALKEEFKINNRRLKLELGGLSAKIVGGVCCQLDIILIH